MSKIVMYNAVGPEPLRLLETVKEPCWNCGHTVMLAVSTKLSSYSLRYVVYCSHCPDIVGPEGITVAEALALWGAKSKLLKRSRK